MALEDTVASQHLTVGRDTRPAPLRTLPYLSHANILLGGPLQITDPAHVGKPVGPLAP